MTQTETRPQTQTGLKIGDAISSLLRDGMPVRFTAYDGSTAGAADADITLELLNQRGLSLPADRTRRPRHGPRLRRRRPGSARRAPGRPVRRAGAAAEPPELPPAVAVRGDRAGARARVSATCARPRPPPQEHLPRWRRTMEGLRHSMSRDAEAIAHHYDVSNAFYEYVLGPSMTYTCAVYESADATLEEAQFDKYDLVCRKLDLKPGQRLLDVGCGWGGMVRHAAREYGVKALGVTLSRQQASWAKEAIDREGLGDLAEVRHLDYRDVVESDFDAVSSIGLTEHIGVRNYPAYFSFLRDRLRPEGRLLNHCITRPHNHRQEIGAFLDRYVFPDGELIGSGRIITEAQNAGLEVMHEENFRAPLRTDARRLVPQPGGELGRLRRRGRRGHRPRLGPLHGRLAARPSSATRSSSTTCSPPRPPTSGADGFPLRPTW